MLLTINIKMQKNERNNKIDVDVNNQIFKLDDEKEAIGSILR